MPDARAAALRADGTFEPGALSSGVTPPSALSVLHTESGPYSEVVWQYAQSVANVRSAKAAFSSAQTQLARQGTDASKEALAAARTDLTGAQAELEASQWRVNRAYDDYVLAKTRGGAEFSTKGSVANDAELSQWSGLEPAQLEALRAAPAGSAPLASVENFDKVANAYRRSLDDVAYAEYRQRSASTPVQKQAAVHSLYEATARARSEELTLEAKQAGLRSRLGELGARENRDAIVAAGGFDDGALIRAAYADRNLPRASAQSAVTANDAKLVELYDGLYKSTGDRYAAGRLLTGEGRRQLTNRLGLLADAEKALSKTSINDSFLTRLREKGTRIRVSTAQADNNFYQQAGLSPSARKVSYDVWYDPADNVIQVQDSLLNGANGALKVPKGAHLSQNPTPQDPTFLGSPEAAAALMKAVRDALEE